MARARSVLRSLAGRAPRASVEESDPGRVLGATNRELCKANETSMFSSVFLARLHLDTGYLEYASAGHLFPFHIKAGGSVAQVASPSAMPVGALADTVYTSDALQLAPGDRLFVYSDGFTEAANVDGVQYGDARLGAELEAFAGAPGRELLQGLLARIRAHCADAPQTDDIAALLLRWCPLSGEPPPIGRQR